MKELWICARAARCKRDKTPIGPNESSWLLIGVFTTREAAAACCKDCRFAICLLPVDQPDLDDGTTQFSDMPGYETPCCECYTVIRNREAAAANGAA